MEDNESQNQEEELEQKNPDDHPSTSHQISEYITEPDPESSPKSEEASTGDHDWNTTPSFQISDIVRLHRFLIWGTVTAFHANPVHQQTTRQPEIPDFIRRLIAENRGREVVTIIKDISVKGRTSKQSNVVLSLAACARSKDSDTKEAAYDSLPDVCRIPTHLFEFLFYYEQLDKSSGWNRPHKRAVCSWYEHYQECPMKMALHVTKYKRYKKWSHKDVLRLAHIKPTETMSKELSFILRYIARGYPDACAEFIDKEREDDDVLEQIIRFLGATEEARHCTDEAKMAKLIENHNLVREHVPTPLLNSSQVWRALIQNMPIMALIRNLNKLSSIGLLKFESEEEIFVTKKLRDFDQLRGSKMHPYRILQANKTYESGHGEKGHLKWIPNPGIIKALEEAFYSLLKTVEPTNKRYLLAVDTTSSMASSVVASSSVTALEAVAAMVICFTRTEKTVEVVGFPTQLNQEPQRIDISIHDRLNQVTDKFKALESIGRGKDFSVPIRNAMDRQQLVDVFVIYTDTIPPLCQGERVTNVLREYRESSGIQECRLVVVGMSCTDFTIADPGDPYMMDVVGFDSDAPEAIRKFVSGELNLE